MHYKYKCVQFFDNIPRTNFKELSGKLCIYGAGFQGLLTAHLLKKQNTDVLCFADMDEKKQGTTYYGLPVISPRKMKELYPDTTVIVTPYSLAPAYKYVKNELGYENTVTPYSLFLEFDSDDFDKLDELPDWYHQDTLDYHIDVFLKNCINTITDYTLLPIDISVTEKCNLRCKECTSLMPCYENPKHFELSQLISEFEIYSKGRIIHNINIEGGEVMIYPHLSEFLDYLSAKENVLNIYLLTNGTVIPNEKILKSLKSDKILVRISNYGKYTKVNELSEVFDKYGINYKFFMQKWYELSSFTKEPKTGKEYYDTVQNCCKVQPNGNGTKYMKNGKLFHCPLQGNLHELGVFVSPETDYIDLHSNNIDLEDMLNDFILTKKFPELCKYCAGRTFIGNEVPPAVQLEKGEKIEVKFV